MDEIRAFQKVLVCIRESDPFLAAWMKIIGELLEIPRYQIRMALKRAAIREERRKRGGKRA